MSTSALDPRSHLHPHLHHRIPGGLLPTRSQTHGDNPNNADCRSPRKNYREVNQGRASPHSCDKDTTLPLLALRLYLALLSLFRLYLYLRRDVADENTQAQGEPVCSRPRKLIVTYQLV